MPRARVAHQDVLGLREPMPFGVFIVSHVPFGTYFQAEAGPARRANAAASVAAVISVFVIMIGASSRPRRAGRAGLRWMMKT
jgi:hypothetical protein